MRILARAFATVDLLIAIAIGAALTGLAVFTLSNNSQPSINVISCHQQTALLADVVACARADQASGTIATCENVDACVLNSSSILQKWPNLTTDGLGNISINNSNYITCTGIPPELQMHCGGAVDSGTIIPMCGDGIVTFPEQCDPPGVNSCGPFCMLLN